MLVARYFGFGAKVKAPSTVGSARQALLSDGVGASDFGYYTYGDLSSRPVLGSASAQNVDYFLRPSFNLSDILDASAARINLGLATVASTGSYTDLLSKPDLTVYAPLASPALTGNPTAPTQAGSDNSTRIATTAFVKAFAYLTGITYAQVVAALGFTPVDSAIVGANSGLATLNSSGQLNTSQIPSSIANPMTYIGTWNATTNSPTLVSGIGTKGYVRRVTVAGTTTIDGVSEWANGDYIVFNGTVYEKWDGTDAVSSVAGRTGAVTLTASDVSLGSVTNDAQTKAAIVPNTSPSAAQLLIGNAGGTAYAPGTLSGDATIGSTGTLTLTSVATAGTSGSASLIPIVTINVKGLVTSITTTAFAASNLSNGTTGSGAVVLAASPTITGTLSATTITASGDIVGANIGVGAASYLYYGSRSKLASPSSGYFTLYNSGANGFTGLQFGGETSSFPMWKRVNATLSARLADDSADAAILAAAATFSGVATFSGRTSIAEGTSTGGATSSSIQNSAFPEFGLNFWGNNHLSLNRNTTGIWESGQVAAQGYLALASATQLWFSNSNTPGSLGGAVDAGIGRNAAGVVEINTGTPGTFAGLKLSTLIASGTITSTVAGAASASALYLTGLRYAGTGTASFPHIFHQETGATAATNWNTSGTSIGCNIASTSGNVIDLKVNGTSVFTCNGFGSATFGNSVTANQVVGTSTVTSAIIVASNYVQCGSTGAFYIGSRGAIGATGNGAIACYFGDGTTLATSVTAAGFVSTAGTITTSQPMITGTQTRNASGVTFQGIFFNATDTASAAASTLLDIQLAGASQLNVGKTGITTLGKGLQITGNGALPSGVVTGAYSDNSYGTVIVNNAQACLAVNQYIFELRGDAMLQWHSTTALATAGTRVVALGKEDETTLGIYTDYTKGTRANLKLLNLTATGTISSTRITRRAVTTTQSATPTINTDNTDVSTITGLAQAITSFTSNLTGTPVVGDALTIHITDDGTGRAIAWGASFEASTVALPATTVASTKLTVGFLWNSATTKWRCVAAV